MAVTIHVEWGQHAIRNHSEADIFIIIDILSFSTCIDIALSQGGIVFPYLYKQIGNHKKLSQVFAQEHNAILASARGHQELSLSPGSLQNMKAGTRLVLPSPNGATLSLSTGSRPTLCASLRNTKAIVQWLHRQDFSFVQLVAAGERWPDGALRPAIEDWLGAGALLHDLSHLYKTIHLSAEAQLALSTYLAVQPNIPELIAQSESGRELYQRGFPEDVTLACQENSSQMVPLFNQNHYRPAL